MKPAGLPLNVVADTCHTRASRDQRRRSESSAMDHIDPLKHSLCACRYWCGRREADTQVGETAGVIPDEAVSIQPVEVVAAEIAVRHAMP